MEKYCRVEQDTDDNIWRMRILCLIPQATNIQTCVILIALSPQPWVHERA